MVVKHGQNTLGMSGNAIVSIFGAYVAFCNYHGKTKSQIKSAETANIPSV